jgi:hypothetical protein
VRSSTPFNSDKKISFKDKINAKYFSANFIFK